MLFLHFWSRTAFDQKVRSLFASAFEMQGASGSTARLKRRPFGYPKVQYSADKIVDLLWHRSSWWNNSSVMVNWFFGQNWEGTAACKSGPLIIFLGAQNCKKYTFWPKSAGACQPGVHFLAHLFFEFYKFAKRENSEVVIFHFFEF